MNPANGQSYPADVGTARFDLYAAGLSTLCLLHCLALPLLVSLMPLATLPAESHLLHQVLALAAVPVSLRVVWKAQSVPGNGLFIAAAVSGLTLLLVAAFVEPAEAYEEPVTVVGGLLLASAHLWHWMRLRRQRGSM